jgi:hypothetical protein
MSRHDFDPEFFPTPDPDGSAVTETIPPPRINSEADPSVPRNADGSINKRTRAGRAAAGLPPKPGSPRPGAGRARNSRRQAAARQAVDYRQGIEGIGQMAAFVAGMTGNQADSAAIMGYTPGIAAAVNDLAQVKPEVAAILDRLMAAGPYGALIAAVSPLILQILCNHGKMPAGLMGTLPPDQLISQVMGGQS